MPTTRPQHGRHRLTFHRSRRRPGNQPRPNTHAVLHIPTCAAAAGMLIGGIVVGVVVGVLAGAVTLSSYSWGARRRCTDQDRLRAQARASVDASAFAAVQQALSGELGDAERVAAAAALAQAGADLAAAPSRIYSTILTMLIDDNDDVVRALTDQFTRTTLRDQPSGLDDETATTPSASGGREPGAQTDDVSHR